MEIIMFIVSIYKFIINKDLQLCLLSVENRTVQYTNAKFDKKFDHGSIRTRYCGDTSRYFNFVFRFELYSWYENDFVVSLKDYESINVLFLLRRSLFIFQIQFVDT